jgi:hypothetical protein
MKALRFTLVPLVALFASAAFAQDMPRATSLDHGVNPKSGEHIQRQPSMKREVAPLLYLLPSLQTKEPATMEIRILQGKRQIISEIVMLPGSITDGSAVDVLVTHPDELKRLRAIETAQPGSLRFLTLVAGRTVTDQPFSVIQAQGAKLSLSPTVGEVSEIDSRPAAKPRSGTLFVHALDQCTDDCDAAYMTCLDNCDERSNSCQVCWTDYQSCTSSCESSCTEPKSTSNYSTSTVTNVSYYGENGCYSVFHPTAFGDRWEHYYVTLQVTTFHRVVHCDDSYTDTQTGQYYTAYWCWYNTHSYCGSSTATPPGPEC